MKRLNLFAILIVGCISPWMFSLEKAQTQVLTECQPDQIENLLLSYGIDELELSFQDLEIEDELITLKLMQGII